MKKALFIVVSIAVLSTAITTVSCRRHIAPDYKGSVRAGHPRLFVTKEDIPNIKSTAQTSAHDIYLQTKESIDKLLNEPISFPNPTAVNGTENGWKISQVSQVAMLYLITGEKKYLDYTKKFLQKITEFV